MKKTSRNKLLTGIFLLSLSSCAPHPDGYILTGTLNGIKTGEAKLVKYNPTDRSSTTIDSAELADGSFTLKGALESPEMMSLTIEPGNWSVPVFMENSEITMKADTTGSRHYDWTNYGGTKGAEIQNYTISGSKNQDEWMKYKNDPALKIYEPVFAKLQKTYQGAANKDEVYVVKSKMDSVRTLLTALQKSWIDSFVTAEPSSAAGAYMVNQYYLYHEDLPLKDMESLIAKFTGPAKSTLYYDILSDAMAKRKALQPGNAAPDFTLLKPDSSSFTLSSLRSKYVLLDFWASWCIPCRKAIPHWKEVYQKYHPKGLEILSITNDSRWNDWFKALKDEKMPWLQVADEFPVKNMPARVAELYMIPYLPTYILLDKEGKIILHNASEEQIDEKLAELLGS